MDELERMAQQAEKYSKADLDLKKAEILDEVEDYEFKTLLDAAEALFEIRAKRKKSIKDLALIKIIEHILKEEPFEYMDEDFILMAYKDYYDGHAKRKLNK
ncbi:hypothetical protein OXPF_33040 [Oxobacter pfennigii]|uniref:Uncharacterized protein n=1 Tax=Oxobacter pfennigii TaxID=36849 RepID=A0A0P8YTM8_9CLOT|nr:hypothetical protein [Oxobacter pfennigii]KPU43054.1 hypothetical protein OXPF_33040 [Oxobacter pfennigii]